MNEQAQALLATRTVAVRLPSGESEYWLTDRVFNQGDTYTRHGKKWEIAEVMPPGRNGHHYVVVRLTEAA
jgi:hypothetical protein